jgi:hypothetical protein
MAEREIKFLRVLSFEECKGRVPIVRHGREFPVHAHDFDNPYSQRHYTARSGGSTGAGTRVHHDLDYLAERAARMLLGYKAHGAAHLPTAVWRGVLPDGSGINITLSMSRIGNPPRNWFTPVSSEQLLDYQMPRKKTIRVSQKSA